jgi:hypothetical protein
MSDPRTGSPYSTSPTSTTQNLLIEGAFNGTRELAGALGQPVFSTAKGIFKSRGYETALKNLDTFLSGVGGTVNYSYDEISSHPLLMNSMGSLRSNFEAKTFTGTTGKKGVGAGLLALKDGEKFTFTDHWDSDVDLEKYWERIKEGDSEDTYFGLGQTGMGGDGSFVAERRGNDVTVTGEVVYRLGNRNEENEMEDEPYDFDILQPGGFQALLLQYAGKAKTFNMHHESRQSVEAKMKIGPNNQLTIDSVTWGPIR